jgi:hypothetical protein
VLADLGEGSCRRPPPGRVAYVGCLPNHWDPLGQELGRYTSAAVVNPRRPTCSARVPDLLRLACKKCKPAGTGPQDAGGGGTYMYENMTDTLAGGRYKGQLVLP